MYGIDSIDFKMIDHHSSNGLPLPPTLEDDAREAIRLAKVGTSAIIALQAIAAIAAFGMLLIQYKVYRDNNKRSRFKANRRAC